MPIIKMQEMLYFEKDTDVAYGDAILLRDEGMTLISQYYKKKYNLNVLIAASLFSKEGLDFIDGIHENRKKPENFRSAFILSGMRHATPVFYIKENSQEAVFVPDSVGNENPRDNYGQVDKIIHDFISEKLPDVSILVVPGKRQADLVSCYADALVFARDVTAKKEGVYFKSPELLNNLISRSTERNIPSRRGEEGSTMTLKDVLLPDELLKSVQTKKFLDTHRSNSAQQSRAVHFRNDGSQENIMQFRERYTEVDAEGKKYNSYLRKKGLKYAKIITIQYYKNQVLNELIQMGLEKEIAEGKSNDFVAELIKQAVTNEQAYNAAVQFVAKLRDDKQQVAKGPTLNEVKNPFRLFSGVRMNLGATAASLLIQGGIPEELAKSGKGISFIELDKNSGMTLNFADAEYAKKLANALKPILGNDCVSYSQSNVGTQFNTVYSGAVHIKEHAKIQEFIEKICHYDHQQTIDLYNAVNLGYLLPKEKPRLK